MHDVIQSKKIRLGDKFLFSGVGDAHANDDWLRMFDKDGGGYKGGFAAGRLWTPGFYSDGNGASVNGTLHVHRGNGDWNWIRVQGNHGDNLYTGSDGTNRGIWADGPRDLNLYNQGNNGLSVRQNGDVSLNKNANVQGKLFFGDQGMSTTWKGQWGASGNNSDPYYLEKKVSSDNNSHLRLTINDDSDESFQIWGNSCGVGNCTGEGQPRFKFFADGRMCIKDTCITEDDLKKLKSILGEGAPQALTAASIRFPAANNTWSIQPESGVAFVVRDNTSGGDKRHAFWKNRYRDA
jgi:hypothetical protein